MEPNRKENGEFVQLGPMASVPLENAVPFLSFCPSDFLRRNHVPRNPILILGALATAVVDLSLTST